MGWGQLLRNSGKRPRLGKRGGTSEAMILSWEPLEKKEASPHSEGVKKRYKDRGGGGGRKRNGKANEANNSRSSRGGRKRAVETMESNRTRLVRTRRERGRRFEI